MNKKRLYESIMREVSCQVKKALNENEAANTVQYMTDYIEIKRVLDDYENGEDPETEVYWDDKRIYTANSVKELVQAICDSYSFDIENAFIFDDDVIIQCLTDEECYPLSESDIIQWQKCLIKGYSTELRFSVHKKTPILHDELVAAGFESYD